MSKNIYMLIGVPGSGKSTWTQKEFQGECFMVSTDYIIDEIAEAEGMTYDEVWSKYIKAAEALMWQEFDRAINGDHYPIVIDRTNVSAKARAKFFNRLKTFHKNHGYQIHAVVFETPEAEEWKRRLDRPGKTIPTHVLESMADNLELPTMAEGFTTIKFIGD